MTSGPDMRRPLRSLAAAILAVVLFFALAEAGLRALGIGVPGPETDPARGFLPFDSLFREVTDSSGERQLVVRTLPHALGFMRLPQFNPQSHPAHKSPGEYRILVIGGSLAYGWPYDDRLSFPRLLEVGLRRVAPERHFRVINMGAPGWGTTRLRALAADLLRLDPDLVVVASGNNEALEASFSEQVFSRRESTIRLLSALSRRSHLVSAMIDLEREVRRRRGVPSRSGRVATSDWWDRRDELLRIFRGNLTAIVETFRSAGARVHLATVPVNLQSCPPMARDGPGEPMGSSDAAWARGYREAAALLERDRAADALASLEPLAEALPESARVHYLRAQAQESIGAAAAAATSYQRALELDRSMLRATPALNAGVERVAAELDVPVADLVAALGRASRIGAPGDGLFLDNCHPTRRGASLLALATAGAMVDDALFRVDTEWQQEFLGALAAYLEALEIPDALHAEALKYLLYYSLDVNPDPVRAARLEQELRKLDPDGRHAGRAFRETFFRARSEAGPAGSRPPR